MDPLKPQTVARIDPWDPDSPRLAVMRIREVADNVVGDPLEIFTYTMPDQRARQWTRLKNLA